MVQRGTDHARPTAAACVLVAFVLMDAVPRGMSHVVMGAANAR